MRHLKRFNETVYTDFKNELQDFCETNLAYLIDDGVIVNVIHLIDPKLTYEAEQLTHKIIIKLPQATPWNEIKDHMIPFLTRLNNKYEVKEYMGPNIRKETKTDIYLFCDPEERANVFMTDWIKVQYQMKKLINDDINFKYNINQIAFMVTNYKKEQPTKKSFVSKIKSFFK
jgi:hypothetical protein